MFRLNYERGAVSSTVTVGGGCVRHTMAGLVVNCVQQYLHHIVDGSPPKAEYVRHFEARSPRALGGQYVPNMFVSAPHAVLNFKALVPFFAARSTKKERHCAFELLAACCGSSMTGTPS